MTSRKGQLVSKIIADYKCGIISDEIFEGVMSKLCAEPQLSGQKPDGCQNERIAIIGMSGCFPAAEDIGALAVNLIEGKDCITEIPKSRWDWEKYYGDPHKESFKTNIKWSGFIEGVAHFDPLFFGISPREAETMDPQQRLLMMHAWKALEDSGYAPDSLAGSNTGIYIGTSPSGYGGLKGQTELQIEDYTATGGASSLGPNRVSYFLDLHGPSEPVDTACSSSLIAIHKAVELLRSGQSTMAVAGGVNTILTPAAHIGFSKAGMLSADGRCKTFSEQADGYVRSEGVGIVVLKPLALAERDRDNIYGVILASAENHGGRANSLTAPNPKAQVELLKTAYRQAGVDPRTITYIEAHGTGTKLGDPIEVNALKSAFQELYSDMPSDGLNTQYQAGTCGLGSVKTNIGHLELAAGVAGVIKVLLQFRHKILFKNLHSETLNSFLDFSESPFYVVQNRQAWLPLKDSSGIDIPRRAGVSSFSVGGVNAHVVLEEYCPQGPLNMPESAGTEPAMIVLSARTKAQLTLQVENLLTYLKNNELSDSDLPNIAYTLQVGRTEMTERMATTATSIEQLRQSLQACADGKTDSSIWRYGYVRKSGEAAGASVDSENKVTRWLQNKDFDQLLIHWTKGGELNWNLLHQGNTPCRISLPTYPFEKKSYWLDSMFRGATDHNAAKVQHPLLHENTSDFTEHRYTTKFREDDLYVVTDGISGSRTFSGMALLEMAVAAAQRSTNRSGTPGSTVVLKDVIWPHQIVLDKEKEIHVGLYPRQNEEILFDVYSAGDLPSGKLVLHAEGEIGFSLSAVNPSADLEGLKMKLGRSSDWLAYCKFTYKQQYHLKHAGSDIEDIYLGINEGLVKFTYRQSSGNTGPEFTLPPSVLDSMVQAAAFILPEQVPGVGRFPTPLALDKLQWGGRCSGIMWAWIRCSSEKAISGPLVKIDIDLFDEHGRVLVKVNGLSFQNDAETGQSLSGLKNIAVFKGAPSAGSPEMAAIP